MAGKPFPYNVRLSGRYGAPLGRSGAGAGHDGYQPMTLRRVPIDGGGYDGGGAYWGRRPRGVMLFCAWSADRSAIRWIDAASYLFAEAAVRADFPSADFRL